MWHGRMLLRCWRLEVGASYTDFTSDAGSSRTTVIRLADVRLKPLEIAHEKHLHGVPEAGDQVRLGAGLGQAQRFQAPCQLCLRRFLGFGVEGRGKGSPMLVSRECADDTHSCMCVAGDRLQMLQQPSLDDMAKYALCRCRCCSSCCLEHDSRQLAHRTAWLLGQ